MYILIFYKCVYIYKNNQHNNNNNNNFFEWSPPWHSIFHIFWHVSDILSGMYILTFFLAFYQAFYLIYLFSHSIWHSMWHLALAIEVPQCPLSSGTRGWGGAAPTDIWRSLLGSGSAHWDLELAVDAEGETEAEGVEAEAGRGRRRWAALLKKFRDLAGGELLVVYPIKSRLTGWWFRTFFHILR